MNDTVNETLEVRFGGDDPQGPGRGADGPETAGGQSAPVPLGPGAGIRAMAAEGRISAGGDRVADRGGVVRGRGAADACGPGRGERCRRCDRGRSRGGVVSAASSPGAGPVGRRGRGRGVGTVDRVSRRRAGVRRGAQTGRRPPRRTPGIAGREDHRAQRPPFHPASAARDHLR